MCGIYIASDKRREAVYLSTELKFMLEARFRRMRMTSIFLGKDHPFVNSLLFIEQK